jgi:CHASE2 domain-containing sensor protein
MLFYEWVTLVYFLLFGGLAWMRPRSGRRREIISAIAVAGVSAILTLRSTVFRDWLPLVFIPLAYFQTAS